MTMVYRLLFFLGILFLCLFAFWYLMPADYWTATYTGEAASSLLCAAGITCLFVGFHIRREWRAIKKAALDAARAEAEADVRDEIARLEAELDAVRAYIAACDARLGP